MSEDKEDKTMINKIRNQIIGIVVSAAMLGLFINFMFISRIDSIITELKSDNVEMKRDLSELKIKVATLQIKNYD